MKIIPLAAKGHPMSRVLHVVIPNRWDLAMTFLRMQEWYESPNPKFARKHFTLEEYMRWYQEAYGNGAFTYPKDWSGFNIPSTAVLAIMNGPKHPYDHPQWSGPKTLSRDHAWEGTWSQAETHLFDALVTRGVVVRPGPTSARNDWDFHHAPQPFYLIGTTGVSAWCLKHEVAHGAYFIYPDRRKAINDAIKRHNVKPLVDWMMRKGYSKWTLRDEVHAYALTGWPDKFKPTKSLLALKQELKQITGD